MSEPKTVTFATEVRPTRDNLTFAVSPNCEDCSSIIHFVAGLQYALKSGSLYSGTKFNNMYYTIALTRKQYDILTESVMGISDMILGFNLVVIDNEEK